MNKKQKNPARFQVLYLLIFSMMFLVISGGFFILIGYQNYQYFQYDNKVLKTSFIDYVKNIEINLDKVQNRIEELRISAEFDLYETKISDFKMPFTYQFIKETENNGITEYHMDEIDEEQKDSVFINLTGDGKLREKDRNFMRVIHAGLNLMDDFHGLKKSVPQIAYTWFVSKEKFVIHYPWLPSSNFSFSDEIYDYDPWKKILPKNNPERKTIWADVYFDDTGEDKNLMTTCVTPIYDGDVFIGNVGVDIIVDYLNEIVRKFEPERSGQMIMYDQHKNIIAHPSELDSNDKGLQKLENLLPEELIPYCDQITSVPLTTLKSINNWYVLRANLKNTPFEVIYLVPKKSTMDLIIGKLGWSSILFILILQILSILVLIFTHRKFINPAEKFVNFILDRSQGHKPTVFPKIPKIWNSWFSTIDNVFDDNTQLNNDLEKQNIELVKNNKELKENIEKRMLAEKENKTLEEQLHISEKMRALGQLAGGAAHDFNNQLSVILSTASVLGIKEKNNPNKKYYDRILAATRRSADLVSQLLTFSKQETFQLKPVNIHSLIEEVEDLLFHSFKKQIKIIKELKADKTIVAGDSTKLQNAIMNIAINAEKAMPRGGTMTFKTENICIDESSAFNKLPDLINGDCIKIVISDTGMGMNEETKSRLFEPFFTTRPETGLGMGLSVVYGTVKSHNGHIEVKSVKDKGTSFTIILPLNEKIEEKKKDISISGNYNDFKKNILLVDDEKEVCDSMAEALTIFGFTVITYNVSTKAVEYYRKSWENIDVVLVDMIMPDLNGYETYMAMKEVNPDIKALAFSGFSMDEDAKKIIDAGVELVQKPVDPQILAERIISV